MGSTRTRIFRKESNGAMDNELANTLGEAAREARIRAGLTQADVAERIGIVTEVYGRIERGLMLPSVETLRRLCRVLRVPSDVLLGLSAGMVVESPPTCGEREPLEVRRLARRLKQLDPDQLHLIGLLAAGFGQRERAEEGDGADKVG